MNRIKIAFVSLGAILLLAPGLVVAESDAISSMAKIVMNLNHYPSDDDKATLKAIVDSDESSEEEASIAMVLSKLEHKVSEADAERLADIVDDDSTDASARKLAGILIGINHTAGDDDKKLLMALAGE